MDYTLSDYDFFVTVKAWLPQLLTGLTILGVITLFYCMAKQFFRDGGEGRAIQQNVVSRLDDALQRNTAITRKRSNEKFDLYADEESRMEVYLSSRGIV